ncbi:hypothetical protein O181_126979, partial [Austropuccinia psidii MF-1]|nr:hypothetical protein [Austropuccinia psidii MF-1]
QQQHPLTPLQSHTNYTASLFRRVPQSNTGELLLSSPISRTSQAPSSTDCIATCFQNHHIQ